MNSATLAAHRCCSKVLEFPCQANREFPDCKRKQSLEIKDVATLMQRRAEK